MNPKIDALKKRAAAAAQVEDHDPMTDLLGNAEDKEDAIDSRSDWLNHPETKRRLVYLVKARTTSIRELCMASTQSSDPRILAMSEKIKLQEAMIITFGGTPLVFQTQAKS